MTLYSAALYCSLPVQVVLAATPHAGVLRVFALPEAVRLTSRVHVIDDDCVVLFVKRRCCALPRCHDCSLPVQVVLEPMPHAGVLGVGFHTSRGHTPKFVRACCRC